MHITIFTDGGSRGNPGEGAIGVVIQFRIQNAEFRVAKKDTIIKIKKRIGVCTNNEAEYQAVIEALKKVQESTKSEVGNIEKIDLYLDSSLVCNQLKGLFKVKEPRMRAFITRIRELEGELKIYPAYHLIPREQNKEADKLVNQALDAS